MSLLNGFRKRTWKRQFCCKCVCEELEGIYEKDKVVAKRCFGELSERTIARFTFFRSFWKTLFPYKIVWGRVTKKNNFVVSVTREQLRDFWKGKVRCAIRRGATEKYDFVAKSFWEDQLKKTISLQMLFPWAWRNFCKGKCVVKSFSEEQLRRSSVANVFSVHIFRNWIVKILE